MIEPANEAQLAEAVAGAAGPLVVRGGGTRPIGQPVSGEVLSVAGLNGVTLYEPGALTLVVKAGTPVAEVEAVLAAEGQRLPFEPMDHRAVLGTEGTPTIGGVVAANLSGPRRVQAGACRDSLIGVRFVDGLGTVVKNGGRVMKNVTGYDLVKLIAGSYGTLGVLTEVAFKVLPVPATVATLVYSGAGWTATKLALTKALGTAYEVSGAGRLPAGVLGEQGAVVLRLEGFADSVRYRIGALQAVLADRFCTPGRVVTDPAENAAIWSALRDVTCFAESDRDLWRISVKPTDCMALSAHLGHEEVALDWGGGLIWAQVPAGTDLRQWLGETAGHATLIRASDETKARLGVFQPEPAPLAAIGAGLRARFDPRGILNPGLMG